MGRPELGTKCTCAECHERFYDLNRSPAVCPKCGAQQPPEKIRVSRPTRTPSSAGFHARRAPVAATADSEVETADTVDAEAEAEDDAPELDDDTDEDIEIDPDRPETTD